MQKFYVILEDFYQGYRVEDVIESSNIDLAKSKLLNHWLNYNYAFEIEDKKLTKCILSHLVVNAREV